MKAPRNPDVESNSDADAVGGARAETQEPDAMAQLAELFGETEEEQEARLADAEADTARKQLAALFAWASRPERESPAAPLEAGPADAADAETGHAEAVGGTEVLDEAQPPPLVEADVADIEEEQDTVAIAPVAAVAAVTSTPQALTWLTADDPEYELRGHHEPVAVLSPAAPASDEAPPDSPAAGERGIRGWSRRTRWSIVVSIVLLAVVVVAAVLVGQSIAASNLEAQELATAVADLEAAEAGVVEPQAVLDAAAVSYDETVVLAQASADSAGPALAAVAGMADEPTLGAANVALAELVAQLQVAPPERPQPYSRGDIDTGDLDALEAATVSARDHVALVTAATGPLRTAQADLQQKLDAQRIAQVALGASLPASAEFIVEENWMAEESFREAVLATAAAVGAAQSAGGTGDAELLAYAAAVTALRADEVRALEEYVPPPVVEPEPAPVPQPQPQPEPEPEPEPEQPGPENPEPEEPEEPEDPDEDPDEE